ncbi:MAG: murein L,D-transpeptidase [Hyphomicrobiaceae bacterium]|nr:murein L,D-transpeptidase [Hyphomicrobiaceae bacterium]
MRLLRRIRDAASATGYVAGGIGALVAVVIAAHTVIATPSYAVTIELKGAAPERIENQRRHAEDEAPLPGTPDTGQLEARLTQSGLKLGSPILIRIFKAQSELEVWMRKDGTYERFATYPVCNWSGMLGPKLAEGDKQTPEGFYTIGRRQLHRIGRWPRSLNLGFPNAFDRSQARTGSYILIHGGCSSVGCFAMTNPVIEEIYTLTRAAIRGGQGLVPVHVFPFRMTDENMAKNARSEWAEFWRNLREGYDAFETTRVPPRISVCDGRYSFQTVAPGEVGETLPLDVCGASLAAMESLEEFASLARQSPLLSRLGHKTPKPVWQQAAATLPPHLKGAFDLYRNAMAKVARLVAANARLPPGQRRRLAKLDPRMRNSSQASCNQNRASCRKFIAMQAQRDQRAIARSERARNRRVRAATSNR